MSPERPRRSTRELRESYDETLDAVRRRFEQLESAVAQFSPDLDESAFTAAWSSDDPSERNRADSVLSSFREDVHAADGSDCAQRQDRPAAGGRDRR